MAYYTGSANNMGEVLSALISACSSNGWSWSAPNISKGNVSVGLQVNAGWLETVGTPSIVKIGPVTGGSSSAPIPEMTYPISYEIFVNTEVVLIINYAIDCYQWLAFGPGDQVDAFVAGSVSGTRTSFNGFSMYTDGGSTGGGSICPGLFWAKSGLSESNYYVYDDGWMVGLSIGAEYLDPFMELAPSGHNAEALLLRARHFKTQPGERLELTVESKDVRLLRIDNIDPGSIVDVGQVDWKVYPCFRKNTTTPNRAGNNHTGCLGFAVRYEV